MTALDNAITADRNSPIDTRIVHSVRVVAGGGRKSRYWRMFAAAVVWHSIAVTISLSFAGVTSVADLVSTLLFGAVVLGLWAALAPRGAVVALVVVLSISTLNLVGAVALGHDYAEGLLILCNVVAFFCAWRAFGLATVYLEQQRRHDDAVRAYEREERWRGSSW